MKIQQMNSKIMLPISFIFLVLFLLPIDQTQAASKDKKQSKVSQQSSMMARAKSKGELPVIIKYKSTILGVPDASSASKQATQQALYSAQATLERKLTRFKPKRIKHFDHLALSAMHLSAEGLEAVMKNPDVEGVYEDQLSRPTLSDSSALIGATTAATAGYSGAGQTVAILDTGVDKTHSFLSGRVVHEACFSKTIASQNSSTVCPNGGNSQIGSGAGVQCSSNIDGCSHGTHVAGIAAGQGVSFSGVAKDANIMAIQVFSSFTGTDNCGSSSPCALSYTSDQLSALEHVYSQRNNFNIAAINMSLGGGEFSSNCDSDPRKDAIDLLRSAGIATVISSGNESFTSSMGAPACISSAISVGSTTKSDSVSSFSNSATFLDLLAPGSSINSSVPGGSFSSFSGTSMAAPQVTGAFAILKSRQASATVDQIESVLKSTGVNVTDSRNGISKPRIQINSAVNILAPPTVATLFVSPTNGFTSIGAVGGPFSPTSYSYTLRNITSSSQALSYTVAENANWLQVGSNASGSIPAGGSVTVTLAVTSSVANTLALGNYSGTISFTNRTNSAGNTTAPASLTISNDNDYFANAIALGQSGEHSGSVQDNSSNASVETNEPDHAKVSGQKSLWWKWTAPSNGEMAIETCNSSFDTALGVYTGTLINALSEVVSNDDDCSLQSRVSFSARAGITYYIAVDGYDGAAGSVVLDWSFTSDSTPTPSISLTPTTDVTFTGPSKGPFTPTRTFYSITNVGSSVQSIQITTPPWLTSSKSSISLAPGASTSTAFIVNTTARTMPPGIYSGIIDFGTSARAVVLNLTSGTLTNDNYQNAINLPKSSQIISWNNELATKQVGEAAHAGNSGGKSVWWKWTALISGDLEVSTEGSTFDTILAVYRGNSLSQLVTVGSDDDSGTGLTSSLTIPVVAGNTYSIAVDGYNGNSGSIQLNLTSDKAVGKDFNGDGKADILWRNTVTGANHMYFMNGASIASNGAVRTIADLNWKVAGTGDFNADGKSDILWRHARSGQNSIYHMNGPTIASGGFINQVADVNWKVAGVGDFNADGKSDILWRHAVSGQNYIYMMNGLKLLSHGLINRVADLNWKIVGVGDFNADGKSDILWRHAIGGQVFIHLMNGKNIVSHRQITTVSDLNWEIVGLGDFNNDQKSDILWRHKTSGTNFIYLMNGLSISQAFSLNRVADLNWKVINVGDLNADGTADILWRNSSTAQNYTYLIQQGKVSSASLLNTLELNWKSVPE